MTDADDDFDRFLTDHPEHAAARRTDATYHAQMDLLRRLLNLADEAMRAEGLPDSARDRVRRRVLFGVPDPDEAWWRQARQEQAAREQMLCAPVRLPAELWDLVPEDMRAGIERA